MAPSLLPTNTCFAVTTALPETQPPAWKDHSRLPVFAVTATTRDWSKTLRKTASPSVARAPGLAFLSLPRAFTPGNFGRSGGASVRKSDLQLSSPDFALNAYRVPS